MEENRYGFEFEYRDRRVVGVSKRLTKEDMDKIDPAKRSAMSALYVRCGKCGKYMDFVDGPTGGLDGRWVCRTCRVYMREQKAWIQLNREVELLDDILSGPDDSENTDE